MLSVVIASRFGRNTLVDTSSALEPTLVPATVISVEFEGPSLPGMIIVDGELRRLDRDSNGMRGSIMLDFTSSVGFHCLRAGSQEWYFGTSDAKLGITGIRRIIEYLGTEALAWSGQLFFADGSAFIHPKVEYAWLERHADSILAITDEIAAHPVRRSVNAFTAGRPGPARVHLARTRHLLRRKSRALMALRADGVLSDGRLRFDPAVVVARTTSHTTRTVGNRRATQVLRQLALLARALAYAPTVPKHAETWLIALHSRCAAQLARPPFIECERDADRLPVERSVEEITDTRYARLFEYAYELERELGWSPSVQRADTRAYIDRADELYQAFVAMVIARAFGASPTQEHLTPRLDIPSFMSPPYELYYDTSPPPLYFKNWRAASLRPNTQRPDLTIIDNVRKRGILTDAKYRVEGGQLPTSGLHDAQVYLQSFNRKSIALFYPGTKPSVRRVSGEGNVILEISIAPFDALDLYATTVVRPELEAAMEAL